MPIRMKGVQVKAMVEMRGLSKILRQFDSMKKEIITAAKDIIQEDLKKLLVLAQQYAPVDTGRLRDSGRVFRPQIRNGGKEISFQVVFGDIKVRGLLVDYAWIVHETHKSKSKYLTKAAARVLPGLANRVSRKLNATLKRIL